jgi:predicted transcriptional regulator
MTSTNTVKSIIPTMAKMTTSRSRRSNMEVKMDILQAIFEGARRPTHIMYRSKLSWDAYLNLITGLEEMELVSLGKVEERKIYKLTDKGARVLETYAQVLEQFGSLQLTVPLA